jgi:hypothetical protein
VIYLLHRDGTTSDCNSLHWFTHSKYHCNCSTHKVSNVFTICFLVTHPNSVLCWSPYRPANISQLTHWFNCQLFGWQPSHTELGGHLLFSSLIDWRQSKSKSKSNLSESNVTTDGQSASLSWYKAPMWGLRADLHFCQTVEGLLMWGAFSDERTCLSFAKVTVSSNKSIVSMYNLHFICMYMYAYTIHTGTLSRLSTADHVLLQQQSSHLNGSMLDRRQV